MREFLRKDGRDSWIYEPTRGVICLLNIRVTSEFLLSFPETLYTKREIWSWFFIGFVRKTANEFKVIWENEAFKLNHKTYRVNFWCSKKTSTNFHVRKNSLLNTNSVLCSREWLKLKKKCKNINMQTKGEKMATCRRNIYLSETKNVTVTVRKRLM